MRKLLVLSMMLSASTAHAGLFDIVADVAKEVSPEAGKAVGIWEKEQQRKQDKIDAENKIKEDALKRAPLDKKRREDAEAKEQARVNTEKKAKERERLHAKYKMEAKREQALYEAKQKQTAQPVAKVEVTPTQAVQNPKKTDVAGKAVQEPVETAQPVKPEEIKQVLKTLDIPKRYANATLMMKTPYLNATYDEYMNFGTWLAKLKRQGDIKKLWTTGGTFTNLTLHIKRRGQPSAGWVFSEDEGEVYLKAMLMDDKQISASNTQEERILYMTLAFD